MEQKHYLDITRLKEKYAKCFSKGEFIVIQEKLDGSNAAIGVDENGKIVAFSRRRQLTAENNLNGFFEFTQAQNKELLREYLGNRFIIFGEWMVKHSVKYPDDFYKNFYVFDVYDKENNQYVPWYMTLLFAKIFDFKTVPVFYMGEFTTWDDVYSYVGKTAVNAQPCGEGIVIKSQNRLTGMNDRCPSYVKIVSEKFSEVHNSHKKEIDPVKLTEKQAMKELAATIITERRITKLLEKFIEDNIIPSDWDEKDMKIIAKNLPKAAYEDCLKEEPEIAAQIEDFGKICDSLSMRIARSLIK